MSEKYETAREWYDGYLFGNTKVYNPWDILCYLDDLTADPDAQPQNYWSNTSGNSVIHTLIEKYGNSQTKEEIEILLSGGSVTKVIHEDLTCNNMYASIDNLWSVLYTTGYLTLQSKPSGEKYTLVIPNREVNNLFSEQIMTLFREQIAENSDARNRLCDAVEAGDSFADIRVLIRRKSIGVIIEMKYAENGKFTDALNEADRQTDRENYVHELILEGLRTIYKYSVACYKKSCRVRCREEAHSLYE